mgnify:CR=1 FL=1
MENHLHFFFEPFNVTRYLIVIILSPPTQRIKWLVLSDELNEIFCLSVCVLFFHFINIPLCGIFLPFFPHGGFLLSPVFFFFFLFFFFFFSFFFLPWSMLLREAAFVATAVGAALLPGGRTRQGAMAAGAALALANMAIFRRRWQLAPVSRGGEMEA